MPASVFDYRFWLLAAAFCLAVAGCFRPQINAEQDRPELLFVVDITGSMNVRDYGVEGDLHSRLDEVRLKLKQTLARLPCGSRAGLAVFSERRSFLLLEPVEVCENFAPLAATLDELDWRMAWEGDSYITKGLESGLEIAESMGVSLVFLSDGHEAPPLPAAQSEIGHMMMQGEAQVRAQTLNTPTATARVGASEKTVGLIAGVGGRSPSPIPKFDETGLQTGFFGADEVEQENRNGPPPADASSREGWHARNAPFGASSATGSEHLSSLKESHLRTLATSHGMTYTTLADSGALTESIMSNAKKHKVLTPIQLAPYLAGLAWVLLIVFYLSAYLINRTAGARRRLYPAANLFRRRAKPVSFTSLRRFH
ncbi:vWA domain-containing protein [Advenella incenata]|jgi:mxaL protein